MSSWRMALGISGLLAFLTLTGVLPAQGNLQKWERIGLQKVDRNPENDTFSVGRDQRFQAIRLRAVGVGVVVEQWVLEYRDGTSMHVGFFGLIPPDRDMPPVPVRPGLKKVRLRYRSAEPAKSAKMEVQGRE